MFCFKECSIFFFSVLVWFFFLGVIFVVFFFLISIGCLEFGWEEVCVLWGCLFGCLLFFKDVDVLFWIVVFVGLDVFFLGVLLECCDLFGFDV